MIATARRLLISACLCALLAGYLSSLIPSTFLMLGAGVCALLAWAAFLLHLRDARSPRPRAPVVRWQDGPTQTVGNPTGTSPQALGQFNRRTR